MAQKNTREKPLLLTAEEEKDLIRKSQQGDLRARNRIICANVPLVHYVAQKNRHLWRPITVDFEDLIQEGVVGMVRAIEKFDVQKDVRFSTYAVWWIRCHMQRFAQDAVRHEMPCLIGTRMSANDRRATIRLDTTEDGEPSVDCPTDLPEAPRKLEEKENVEQLREILERAAAKTNRPGLAKAIVEQRLMHDSPRTLSSLSKEWGFSREWVRIMERDVIDNARKIMEFEWDDLMPRIAVNSTKILSSIRAD